MMELSRGMIVEYDYTSTFPHLKSLVMATNGNYALVIDLLESKEDAIALSYKEDDSVSTTAFICQFYCKELEQTFSFNPKFRVQHRVSDNQHLITRIEERSITSVLISLSSIIIPKDEQYRVFMCVDSGEPHFMGFWNDPKNQEEFVHDYMQSGVEFTAKKYNISETTARSYWRKISKILGIRDSRRTAGFWDDPENAQAFMDVYEERGVDGICEVFGLLESSVRGVRYRCCRALGIKTQRKSKVITSPEVAKKFLHDAKIYRPKALAEMYNINPTSLTYYRRQAEKVLQESGEK